MSGLKLGLNLKKSAKQQPTQPKPRKALFNHEDEEDEEEAALSKGKPKLKGKFADPAVRVPKVSSGPPAQELDPSIYDYDAAYDSIHARDALRKAEQQKAAEERKSQYIDGLMASAETRKQNLLRAKEKMLHREREAEGDEFADKEKFVTEAYRKQQEENRKLEEAEKRREEEEEEQRRKMGAAAFYKHVLEEREKVYEEADEAASKVRKDDISKYGVEQGKSEQELANEARAKGHTVILNDEGQVADKRDLLSAGLNIVAAPKQNAQDVAAAKPTSDQRTYRGPTSVHRAMRERQSKMIEAQLLQQAKRSADAEMEERQKTEHAAKSRKTDQDISSAKERYLQRKREADAAKAANKEP